MAVKAKTFHLKVERIQRVAYEDWPSDWLQEADCGDLLLGPGEYRAEFGILCVDNSGAFLNLTQDQIYRQADIPWPDPQRKIKAIRIVGNQVKLVVD